MTKAVSHRLQIHRFESLNDADETLTYEMKHWARTLSQEEETALRDYKDALDRQLNLALRASPGDDLVLLEVARTLKGALARAVLPVSLQVWRAMGRREWALFKALAPGAMMVSKTFISASIDKDVADKLAEAEDRVVVEIIVATGTCGAAYVHPFPDYDHEEFEILLNIGTKVSILEGDNGGFVILAS